MEGSKKYQQLMISARDYFLSTKHLTEGAGEKGGEGDGGEGEGEEGLLARDLIREAGLRIVQLLTPDPGSEIEVRERFRSLSQPDGTCVEGVMM